MPFLKGTGCPQSHCQKQRPSAQFETGRTAEHPYPRTKICVAETPSCFAKTDHGPTFDLKVHNHLLHCTVRSLGGIWNLPVVFKALGFFGEKYLGKGNILLKVYLK